MYDKIQLNKNENQQIYFNNNQIKCNNNENSQRTANYNRKHYLTIRKFYQIYSNLSGKKFIVETSRENLYEIKYRDKLKKLELLIGLVALLSICNAIAHYELSYSIADFDNLNPYYNILLYSCPGLSMLLYMLLMFSELTVLHLSIALDKIQIGETLLSTGQYKKLIIYFILILFHPNILCKGVVYTFHNNQINVDYQRSINSLLTIFILLRFYFVFRCYFYNSSYLDPDSKIICRMHNFEPDMNYSLKSLVKNSPLKVYFLTLIISVFIFSYTIRNLERSVSKSDGPDFNKVWNAVWYVFITMTTVRYGDFTAKFNESRIIIMGSCVIGVFLISMMIVTNTNVFSFNLSDVNSFILIKKAHNIEKIYSSAKKVIFDFSKIVSKHSFNKLRQNDPKQVRNLLKSIRNFKQIINSNLHESNDFNFLLNYFNFIDNRQETILKDKKIKEEQIENIKNKVEEFVSKLKILKKENYKL